MLKSSIFELLPSLRTVSQELNCSTEHYSSDNTRNLQPNLIRRKTHLVHGMETTTPRAQHSLMVQMYTPPAVWPCSAEVNRNFVNHFSGNRFCDNMGLREQGSSPSCMSKDRTLTQVQSAKREKMRWIQPSSFKMKTYPRASHISFSSQRRSLL